MNSCACISYRSKKRCLQASAYATAICVKLKLKKLKLAGRLSTTRFFCLMLMNEARSAIESINIGQKNRSVLKRPAKSFTKCLTK